jgi:hypothetical protein
MTNVSSDMLVAVLLDRFDQDTPSGKSDLENQDASASRGWPDEPALASGSEPVHG